MNRRTLLAGFLAAPTALALGASPVAASLHNHTWHVVENKLGMRVHYSSALAADLWAVHGIDAETLVKNMHGTQFTIKRGFTNKKTMFFTLITNNKVDGEFSWYHGTNKDNTKLVVKSLRLSQKYNTRKVTVVG